MSEQNMLDTVKANIELLILEHKYVVLVAAGERHEGLQKMLSRNEVAELLDAELIRLIPVQLGTPGSRSIDSRVHESDGSPLLLGTERTDKRPSCSKDSQKEVVWRAFNEFDLPRKVIRAEWDSSSPLLGKYMTRPTVKIIYTPNIQSSFCYILNSWWKRTVLHRTLRIIHLYKMSLRFNWFI